MKGRGSRGTDREEGQRRGRKRRAGAGKQTEGEKGREDGPREAPQGVGPRRTTDTGGMPPAVVAPQAEPGVA